MRQGDEDEEVAAAVRSVCYGGGPGALPGEKMVEIDREAPG